MVLFVNRGLLNIADGVVKAQNQRLKLFHSFSFINGQNWCTGFDFRVFTMKRAFPPKLIPYKTIQFCQILLQRIEM